MTNEQKQMIKGASELLAEVEKPKTPLNSSRKSHDRGSRKHTVITYIDPTLVRRFLTSCNWVEHWAMCTHDKDVTDEGKPKETHTHIVLYTFEAKSSSAIIKLFDRFSISVYGKDNKQNTLYEICNDIQALYRYLIHADDPQKYQYDPSVRFVDDIGYWSKYEKGQIDKPNTGLSMVTDLLIGTPYRLMAERYGKEFIYHSKYIEDCVRHIRLEECETNSPIDDELIKAVLDTSPFGVLQIDMFFNIIAYLRETFGNCYNNTQGFEIYLKKLGLE